METDKDLNTDATPTGPPVDNDIDASPAVEHDDEALFDEYLDGALAPEEVTSFEARLAADADFSRQFNEYRSFVSSLSGLTRQAMPERDSRTVGRAIRRQLNTKQHDYTFLMLEAIFGTMIIILVSVIIFSEYSTRKDMVLVPHKLSPQMASLIPVLDEVDADYSFKSSKMITATLPMAKLDQLKAHLKTIGLKLISTDEEPVEKKVHVVIQQE